MGAGGGMNYGSVPTYGSNTRGTGYSLFNGHAGDPAGGGTSDGTGGTGIGGPEGNGPMTSPMTSPNNQTPSTQLQNSPFQIKSYQAENDINMYPWRSGHGGWDNGVFNQAPPINWGTFFNLFGGK